MPRVSTSKLTAGALAFAAAYAYRVYKRRDEPSAEEQAALKDNAQLFKGKELKLLQQLLQLDQRHLFDNWKPPGEEDAEKARLVEQLQQLDQTYPGGLAAYVSNAKRLLADSKAGANPFEGYTPSVPQGENLDFGSAEFQELEREGVKAASNAAFVLVAGGLGERLGFSGIKLALPADTARGACFLQVYIESILALQKSSGASSPLPLAIMTSDDTHALTEQLLEEHSHFGMQPDQVTLLKQAKVACLSDTDAHLALDPKDGFKLQTKPHGHGDVHALLHGSGLLSKWQQQGVRWVAFFQDTNGLVFRAIPAALGVSAQQNLDVNSIAVPRAAKEAIGGIARLTHSSGRAMTINVEYNQLDPLLRATGHPDGDVADSSGFSPYPGNINQLILKVDSYAGDAGPHPGPHSGDFPRELPDDAKVGFTSINQVWGQQYSPVRNSPEDARAKHKSGTRTL
ncbi:hypothetical protein WJX73_000832 [Symbiochloris irregularis]|uniref:UTP-monosaccharide-1-phosphate uridylyltransferase n=1 Tax=Symbiochloris irregularis TaxID=706552 RepID=A0AAW1NNJ1_9CHLO